MADINTVLAQLAASNRVNSQKLATMGQVVEELKSLVRAGADAPKYIENIPGRRVPYIAEIDITIASGSSARVEGTYPVSQDGPYVLTGLAAFWQRTTAPYNNYPGPATTVGLRMAPASQNVGFDNLFDTPVVGSFNLEIADSASDRNWQNQAFTSAILNPDNGYMFMFPVSYLFPTNTVARVYVTPTVAQEIAGQVLVVLLGYKIVQGQAYQP